MHRRQPAVLLALALLILPGALAAVDLAAPRAPRLDAALASAAADGAAADALVADGLVAAAAPVVVVRDARTGEARPVGAPGPRGAAKGTGYAGPEGAEASPLDGPCDAGCEFTISANFSRTNPWSPIDVRSAYTAEDDGFILRLRVNNVPAGRHSWAFDVFDASGERWAWCGPYSFTAPSGGYSYYVATCSINNELSERLVADFKKVGGTFTVKALWDGQQVSATNAFSMAPVGLRVGAQDIERGPGPGETGDILIQWWTNRRDQEPLFSIRNTGTSRPWSYQGRLGDEVVRLEVRTSDPGDLYATSIREYDFDSVDAVPEPGTTTRGAVFKAATLEPGERKAGRFTWFPGDVLEHATRLEWRGRLRLTPNYWMETEWVGVPKVTDLGGGLSLLGYPTHVSPDDPALASDLTWPAVLYIDAHARDLRERFRDDFDLRTPETPAGNVVLTLRPEPKNCGGAAAWMPAMFILGGCTANVQEALHTFAMEFHHLHYHAYDAPRMLGGSGVLEGCAEVAQEDTDRRLSLGVPVGTVTRFLANKTTLSRDPYLAGDAIPGGHWDKVAANYGSTWLVCQMWTDVLGLGFGHDLAEAWASGRHENAAGAYAEATGIRSELGAIAWRWYVLDKFGASATHPLRHYAAPSNDAPHSVRNQPMTTVYQTDLALGKTLTARFDDFNVGWTYTVTVVDEGVALGSWSEAIVFHFEHSAAGGLGAARMVRATPGVPVAIPAEWKDDREDAIGVAVLATQDPGDYHPVRITLAGVPGV